AGPVAGLVPHVGDAGDPAVPGQLGDLGRQVVRVDLVWQLGNDQAGPALAVLLDLDDRPHRDRAPAGAVGLLDAAAADDQGACAAVGPAGEVRALDPLDQRLKQFLV